MQPRVIKGVVKGVVYTSLFLAYPYLVFVGIENGVVWFAPALFAFILLWQGMRTENLVSRLSRIFFALGLLAGSYYLQNITAKVMPVLIQLMLLYFFASTLIKGPPLIESFVRLEFSDLPPEIIYYCRQLTWLWSGFFVFNSITCIVLALWASDRWWALFNGVVIYFLIGVLTLGEYIYRHYRFPGLTIPDPKSTIRNMFVNGRKVWLDIESR